MNCEQYQPYIISADVKTSLTSWADKTGYTVPKETYFQGMLADTQNILKNYYPDVEIISESEMEMGLQQMAARNTLPIISLDRFYTKDIQNIIGFLDFTRSVDATLTNAGLVSRTSTGIDTQIQNICNQLDAKEPITFLDDVIFGGDTMLSIISRFQTYGVTVENVIAGIAIQEGIDKLNEAGVRVDTVITYETVIDEICERDFVIGAPNSGRTIIVGNKTYGVPYLLPFGKPNAWASIPKDKEQEFSLFCVTQGENLWTEIERKSSAKIPNRALNKPIYGINDDRSVAEELKTIRKQLQGGLYE